MERGKQSMDEKVIIKSETSGSKAGTLVGGFIIAWLLGVVTQYLIEGQFSLFPFSPVPIWFSIAFLPFLIIYFVFFFMVNSCELVVTDKRVYGKAAFGKRVDLPVDSITAVGTGLFSSVSVTTSSGGIKFYLLGNKDEIHEAISTLIVKRQDKSETVTTTTIKQELPQSAADELKKFKDLADSGVITQEEFEAKKKQLLGL